MPLEILIIRKILYDFDAVDLVSLFLYYNLKEFAYFCPVK